MVSARRNSFFNLFEFGLRPSTRSRVCYKWSVSIKNLLENVYAVESVRIQQLKEREQILDSCYVSVTRRQRMQYFETSSYRRQVDSLKFRDSEGDGLPSITKRSTRRFFYFPFFVKRERESGSSLLIIVLFPVARWT